MITPRHVGVALVAVALSMVGCASEDAAQPPSAGATDSVSPAPTSSATTSPSEPGALDHSNEFDIYPGTGVTSVAFTWNDQYHITESQAKTWKGVTSGWSTDNPDVYAITAEAGREADPTDGTLNWFQAQAPIASSTWAPDTCGPWGSSGQLSGMNFAFGGTLTINGKVYPLAIAQFNNGSGNTWAYGGPGWQGPMCGTSFVTPDGAFALVNRNTGPESNYSITIAAQ